MNALTIGKGVLQIWQEGLIGNLSNQAPHDDRFTHNAPPVIAPAMTQDQFEFDNEMDKELLRLSNPLVLAREVWLLRERVKELENDNGS